MAATPATTPFFNGILANGRSNRPGANMFRRYVAFLTTDSTIAGAPDLDLKRIFYEVGRATNRRADTFRFPDEDSSCLARKYSNFAGTFDRAALYGVVRRIAAGLSQWSFFQDVSSATLRNGRALAVYDLGTMDAPVSSHNNYVFIPSLFGSVLTPNVFSVLASSVVGEGSVVVTDVVAVNLNDRSPLVGECTTEAFPRACVDALRLLGANFASCGAGDLFSLAVVDGLNAAASVVGHTEEGGLMRDVLRRAFPGAPFGGIHTGLEVYTGLPALVSTTVPTVSAYVDALLLPAAALVAHCDPGLTLSEQWFPTLIGGCGPNDPVDSPGAELAPHDSQMARNKAKLTDLAPAFSSLYCPALCKMFGFMTSGGAATRILNAKFLALPPDCRHLRYASVAPWFWIEPTSLVPHDVTGYITESEGFAAKCTRGIRLERPAFEYIEEKVEQNTAFSKHVIVFRGATACNFISHWGGHLKNGLGAVTPRQLDPERIIHPGRNDTHPNLADRLRHSSPMSSYLWLRGQSPLPAPGEFLNLSATMGIQMRHYLFDLTTGIPTLEHLPRASEVSTLRVGFQVGIPIGLADGASNHGDSHSQRARTRAAEELEAVAP